MAGTVCVPLQSADLWHWLTFWPGYVDIPLPVCDRLCRIFFSLLYPVLQYSFSLVWLEPGAWVTTYNLSSATNWAVDPNGCDRQHLNLFYKVSLDKPLFTYYTYHPTVESRILEPKVVSYSSKIPAISRTTDFFKPTFVSLGVRKIINRK